MSSTAKISHRLISNECNMALGINGCVEGIGLDVRFYRNRMKHQPACLEPRDGDIFHKQASVRRSPAQSFFRGDRRNFWHNL